ncbi:hypothetical protein [Corallococcus sp. AB049A]|uniref:hypothetical protein n=1 Tax=Corallococcus sp. AB049A TaxID=2316721 RepID=UPI0011C3DE8B|nr:hypothetical protein [Corallococcus sp. AB049A]
MTPYPSHAWMKHKSHNSSKKKPVKQNHKDHTQMTETASDEEVLAIQKKALLDFPHLQKLLPAGYPSTKFGITRESMHEYAGDPSRGYWHRLNLPLALHSYCANSNKDVHTLMKGVLSTLDAFCDKFAHLPGAEGLLRPLWTNPWTVAPEIWSIFACAHIALTYANQSVQVAAFEAKIGNGQTDADIAVSTAGGLLHVEIETYHKAELANKTEAEIIAELEHRATLKSNKKFKTLPANENGVIAIVCVLSGQDVRQEKTITSSAKALGTSKNIHWIACRLVGVRDERGLRPTILPL